MEHEKITGAILDASFEIHRDLGPGLLESVYEAVLCKVLQDKGFVVSRQVSCSFSYQGICFEEGFRCDLLVNKAVVVELKSIEKIAPVHAKQVLTYLRLMNLNVGLLINFGAPILKEGVKRIVNHYSVSSASPRLRASFKG